MRPWPEAVRERRRKPPAHRGFGLEPQDFPQRFTPWFRAHRTKAAGRPGRRGSRRGLGRLGRPYGLVWERSLTHTLKPSGPNSGMRVRHRTRISGRRPRPAHRRQNAWAVDWSWPTRGAAFIDPAMLVVQLVAAGHTAVTAESWAARCKAWVTADPRAIDIFAAAAVRMWAERADSSPDEPCCRAMSAAAEAWAAHRGIE